MNGKDKTRRKWRNYRWAVALCAVLALVCICLIVYDASPEHAVPAYVMTLVNSTLGAVIGIVAVNLVYQWHAEKDLEDDMTQTVVEALSGREPERRVPRMYELYNKRSIERILRQCLESFCTNGTLANGYLSYIKNSYALIKKDEEYEVEVTREADGRMYIRQELADTRIFRPKDPASVVHKSYLIFKKGRNVARNSGKLDAILSDPTYFFREEMNDAACVDELVALCRSGKPRAEVTAAVIAYLNYRVDVCLLDERERVASTVPLAGFEIRLDTCMEKDRTGKGETEKYCGLHIEARIPREAVKSGAGYYEEEGFRQYRARMSICYSIPSDTNTFYAVYPVPTYKSTFKIQFDIPDFNCKKHLDYMTFLSFADVADQDRQSMLDNDGAVRVDRSAISFSTVRTIFPRSGFTFCWDNAACGGDRSENRRER